MTNENDKSQKAVNKLTSTAGIPRQRHVLDGVNVTELAVEGAPSFLLQQSRLR
ncbi:hypothetical protein [Paraburkholderia monticola]|uniref:hypothetical protein n=1 Tax=Paraburkholderia monticola TaxID=1399968 RepID=UPI001379EA50|nr:hypothetical protein [Paraburkholderia monticola]